MTNKRSSCTMILVGKEATLDGSTMIAREEDSSNGANPKRFVVIEPKHQPKEYHSTLTNFSLNLPAKKDTLRYTATPDAHVGGGIFGESGINELNVAMTATETTTANARILGIDPLVKDGIGEEDMLTVVLPYIKSAKEGVLRLGKLIEQYGTCEINGVAFSDSDEVWYLETYGGHQWASVKIPDDAYVVLPNRSNITDFDFEASDTLASPGLKELIDKYQLNPQTSGYNLRQILGTNTQNDTRYNNPRAWYGQKYLTKDAQGLPTDQDLPFICHADRKISVEDLKFLLSSHYQNTPYDPYGKGDEALKKVFRPMALDRNQEGHILQIRNQVPDALKGVHWLFVGPNTFSCAVPFYANINDTPKTYRDVSDDFDLQTQFWLTRALAVLGDRDYAAYSALAEQTESDILAFCRHIQLKTDLKVSQRKLARKYLTDANKKMADYAFEQTNLLFGKLVAKAAEKMTLKF